jgi:hypothetical protein
MKNSSSYCGKAACSARLIPPCNWASCPAAWPLRRAWSSVMAIPFETDRILFLRRINFNHSVIDFY